MFFGVQIHGDGDMWQDIKAMGHQDKWLDWFCVDHNLTPILFYFKNRGKT
jgi:hypothetical protein